MSSSPAAKNRRRRARSRSRVFVVRTAGTRTVNRALVRSPDKSVVGGRLFYCAQTRACVCMNIYLVDVDKRLSRLMGV